MARQVSVLGGMAILLSVASWPAAAFDVGVGGISVSTDTSGGGIGVSVGAGDSSTSVSVGGGSDGSVASVSTDTGGTSGSGGISIGGDSIASVGGGVDGTGANAAITNSNGQLVDLNQSGKTTQGTINLGGLTSGLGGLPDLSDLPGLIPLPDILGGIPGTPGTPGTPGQPSTGLPGPGGGGSVTPVQLAQAYGTLDPNEQMLLRTKCTAVLHRPGSYDVGLVTLCKVIGRMSR